MTASLARFLPDFELSRISVIQAGQQDGTSPESPAAPAIDVDAVRAQARAEGEAEAREHLTRQHQLELEAEQARHAAELEAMKAELAALAARTIPEAVAARSGQIAETIAGDVEAVLAPVLDKAIRARILVGLADEIRSILELDHASRICVSGPETLITALRDVMGTEAEKLVITETDGFELEIEVDRTRFASRMSVWAEALAESLS